MHISKVELEDIKSHIDSKFEFSRGTTAITGRNGAGKTTIIEAIAWTLFDVLDYKKEDFVRRGAKKGVAKVTFESGLDEREYIVYRDTATGYNVVDPQLGKRIADKREEVTRFLWQHLGLEPGTDLRALFKEAVGVPQWQRSPHAFDEFRPQFNVFRVRGGRAGQITECVAATKATIPLSPREFAPSIKADRFATPAVTQSWRSQAAEHCEGVLASLRCGVVLGHCTMMHDS